MRIQAAAISLQGVNFVVALVPMSLVQNHGEADMAIDGLRPHFGGVPLVLMAQDDEGSPTYYGDGDLVQMLADVPVDKMPWKEYAVG